MPSIGCSGVPNHGSLQICTCPMNPHLPERPRCSCIMLIHGGFWKKQYTYELMQPIANALSDAGVASWNIEFRRWEDGDEGVWMDTYRMFFEHGGNLHSFRALTLREAWSWALRRRSSRSLMASKAERKPWLAIAQSPITDLFGRMMHNSVMREMQFANGWVAHPMKTNLVEESQSNRSTSKVTCSPDSRRTGCRCTHEQSETYARAMKAKGCDVQKVWLLRPLQHHRCCKR